MLLCEWVIYMKINTFIYKCTQEWILVNIFHYEFYHANFILIAKYQLNKRADTTDQAQTEVTKK